MTFYKHLICIWAMAASTALGATDFYAQASTAETNVFLGQVFNVDVVVKAPVKPAPPVVDNLPDFNVALLDEGKATTATNTWHYRFAFRAKKAGDLKIPSLRFDNLSTEPINIKANKPELTDRMKLQQRLSAASVYVGEPVLLNTVWDSTYQFGSIKAVDFHFPILNDGRFQVLDPFAPDKETSSQATGLPVQGTRILATRQSYDAEGVQQQTLTFDKLLILSLIHI